MINKGSAKRYAQAIFEIALSEGQVDSWVEDLRHIRDVVMDEDFRVYLQHVKVPIRKKISAIRNVLPEVSDSLRKSLYLMVSRGVLGKIPDVVQEYSKLLDEYHGRELVTIISAVPLEDYQIQSICRYVGEINGKEVVPLVKVHPEIIGGLILRIGDKLIDGSTRSKLENMQKELLSAGPVHAD